jgi:hypothetical protein
LVTKNVYLISLNLIFISKFSHVKIIIIVLNVFMIKTVFGIQGSAKIKIT